MCWWRQKLRCVGEGKTYTLYSDYGDGSKADYESGEEVSNDDAGDIKGVKDRDEDSNKADDEADEEDNDDTNDDSYVVVDCGEN